MERKRKQTRNKADGRRQKAAAKEQMISPDEAYQMLLGMGGTASLVDVREALVLRHGEDAVPSVKTLYAWSSKYKWRDRLAKLETMTVEEIENLIVQDKVKHRARQIGMLMTVSEKATARVAQTLAQADEVFNQSIRNAADLKRLIDLADTAGKYAELLDGRATGRQDIRNLQEDQDDDVVLRRAQRYLSGQKQDQDDEHDGSGLAGDESGSTTPPGSDQLH